MSKNLNSYCDTISIDPGDCGGEWNLVKLVLPASKTSMLTDASKEFYSRTRIGNHGDFNNTEGVTACIDDIRFAPQSAQVSTVYYDTKWQQPRTTVNANGKPGDLAAYDSFGRLDMLSKINPAKAANEPGFATTLQSKKYHLMNEVE